MTVTGKWYQSNAPAVFGNVIGDCQYKPFEEREFNDRWGWEWQYDDRNYVQHHDTVCKMSPWTHARIKAKVNKPDRIGAIGGSRRDKVKGNLAHTIAADAADFFIDHGAYMAEDGNSDTSSNYSSDCSEASFCDDTSDDLHRYSTSHMQCPLLLSDFVAPHTFNNIQSECPSECSSDCSRFSDP